MQVSLAHDWLSSSGPSMSAGSSPDIGEGGGVLGALDADADAGGFVAPGVATAAEDCGAVATAVPEGAASLLAPHAAPQAAAIVQKAA